MHEPVLLKEVASFFKEKKGGMILDCTVGSGGHTRAVIESLKGECKVLALDQDEDAIARSRENLKDYLENIRFENINFSRVDEALRNAGISKVDGCILDLGVSNNQLTDKDRGFSFRHDGPLDMRMDKNGEFNARDVVNSYSEGELYRIFRKYGEERNSRRIAKAIADARKKQPIERTSELAEIVVKANRSRRFSRVHPATRVFQAVRIEVNKELENLEIFLDKIVNFLNEDAVITVISFHSLEDRIVKLKFRDYKREGILKILTKKPIIPTEEEITENRKARSAKLRAAKRSLSESDNG